MSDAKGSSNDPSMDDILASIRKIISDDEARAQVSGGASPPAQPQSAPAGPAPTPPPSAKRDDVLLLTDLVDEPLGAPSPSPPSRPTLVPPPPRIDPVSAAEMPQPSIAPLPPAQPIMAKPTLPPAPPIPPTPSVTAVEPSVKQPPADHSLVEPGAAGLAASAFDRLSQAVQEAVPQPMANDPGPLVGPSGRNLEDIVKELLKPMLKEWLDKNLPAMVERFVEREIVRLTRR
jgi:cell pole-organizing protein PopZ